MRVSTCADHDQDVLIFTVMSARLQGGAGFHPPPPPTPSLPACRGSLCSRCAQIDQVAVTWNESPALSIMSARLDKSLHSQRICPHRLKHGQGEQKQGGGGGEGWRKGGGRKKALASLTSASFLRQPGHQTTCIRLAFLLARWE